MIQHEPASRRHDQGLFPFHASGRDRLPNVLLQVGGRFVRDEQVTADRMAVTRPPRRLGRRVGIARDQLACEVVFYLLHRRHQSRGFRRGRGLDHEHRHPIRRRVLLERPVRDRKPVVDELRYDIIALGAQLAGPHHRAWFLWLQEQRIERRARDRTDPDSQVRIHLHAPVPSSTTVPFSSKMAYPPSTPGSVKPESSMAWSTGSPVHPKGPARRIWPLLFGPTYSTQ